MNYASLIFIIISIVIRSSAGLQLHGGEAGRDGGGHGRRPLLAVQERLSGMDSSRISSFYIDWLYAVEQGLDLTERTADFGLGSFM